MFEEQAPGAAAAIEQDKLVRTEVHRGWLQVQELERQLSFLPVASFVVLQQQEDDPTCQLRSALVDKVTQIISIFSNVVAGLHCQNKSKNNSTTTTTTTAAIELPQLQQQTPSPETLVTTSDCSHSDQESSPKKRKASVNSSRSNTTTTTTTTTTTGVVDPKNANGEACPDDDGHSWRKYGQKEILGSRYPKSYYRCTHKRESGCPAIKYVQRSDKDPSIFHVTYKGEHNCHLTSQLVLRKPQQSQHQHQQPHQQQQQQQSSPYYQVQMNSACLRMNSNGGLSLGPTGPTLPPITLPAAFAAAAAAAAAGAASPAAAVAAVSRSASEEVVAEHTPFDLDFILESPALFSMDDASLFDAEELLPCLLSS